MAGKITLFGEARCPKAYVIRDFLQRNGAPYQWIEITSSEEAHRYLGLDSEFSERLPALVVGATTLYSPTLRDIASAIGSSIRPSCREYDLAIVGAGPAGLSAAVYGASEGLRAIVVERYSIGGQAGSTSRIENYLGFPQGLSGVELASRAREQAVRFGAEILLAAECVDGLVEDGRFNIILNGGETIVARAVICATGVEYGRLHLPNETQFIGRGLYYGAGSSEANLCSGHVFVIGGGNSAGQAALHLASRASKVTMLVRGESLKATLSQYLVDRIRVSPNIEVRTRTVLTGVDGDTSLERIAYQDLSSEEEFAAETGWVFVCVGGRPQTEWTGSSDLARDAAGYMLTGMDLLPRDGSPVQWSGERNPYPMETCIAGCFAAGDIRSNSVKRCATSVGEGAMAVASVHRFLIDEA